MNQEYSETSDIDDLEYYNSPTAIREEMRIEEEKKKFEELQIQEKKLKNKLTKEQIKKKIIQLKNDYKTDFVKAKN